MRDTKLLNNVFGAVLGHADELPSLNYLKQGETMVTRSTSDQHNISQEGMLVFSCQALLTLLSIYNLELSINLSF